MLLRSLRRQAQQWGEGEGHGSGVNVPAQDGFGSGPAGITSKEFLERDGILAVRPILGVKGPEDVMDCMEEGTEDVLAAGWWSLRKGDKVIHEDIDICEGLSSWACGWVGWR